MPHDFKVYLFKTWSLPIRPMPKRKGFSAESRKPQAPRDHKWVQSYYAVHSVTQVIARKRHFRSCVTEIDRVYLLVCLLVWRRWTQK